jgi:choline dehydrogenase-like flavoprotein
MKNLSCLTLVLSAFFEGLTLPLPAAADTTSENQYDYVVIGSGAGGGPVAARLAENGFRVLVLEAGGKVDDYAEAKDKREAAIYHAPLNHGLSTEWRETRWRYFVRHNHLDHLDTKYEPRNSGAADAERGLLYPRASTLGGCTAHHAMITISAHDSDWDGIAKFTGDDSWSAGNMRAFQQKVEKLSFFGSGGSVIGKTWNRLTTGSTNPGRNGYEGWLPVTRAPLLLLTKDLRLTKSVLETIKLTDDAEKERKLPDKFAWHDWHPNDWRTMHESPTGFIRTPYSANNGMRTGTRERLLDVQARHPDRLCIAYHSFATRLLMKPGRSAGIDAEVTGVEYEEGQALYAASADYQKGRRGITRQVFPKKEVIVSCGAFNTPQLLMLSGIGPRKELERVESVRGRAFSPRVIREGVGRNLQDRYEVVLTVGMIDKQGGPKNWSSLKKVTAGQGRAWSPEKEHTVTVPHRYAG